MKISSVRNKITKTLRTMIDKGMGGPLIQINHYHGKQSAEHDPSVEIAQPSDCPEKADEASQ